MYIMKKILERKISRIVEKKLSIAIKRELDEDTLPYIDSTELVLFLVSTIFQTLAAPFVADAYNKLKKSIIKKTNDKGINLTEDDAKSIIYDSYIILKDANEVDITWTSNWTYEK